MPLVLSQTPTPWVTADRPCYVAPAPITLQGGGFAPDAPLRVTREGELVAQATSADDGTFTVTVDSGALRPGVAERVQELTVSDPDSTVVRHVHVTTVGAWYAPTAAAPDARVRFWVFGFGASRPVYVHYIAPGGRVAHTTRLGRTTGDCGRLRSTTPQRLFPFTPKPGRWRLQIDTQRRLDPQAAPRVVLRTRVG